MVWEMFKHEEQRFMNRLFTNQMIVIHQQNYGLSEEIEFVQELQQDSRERRWLWRTKQGQSVFPNSGQTGAQGCYHRKPETNRVIIQCIEGKPGNGKSRTRCPHGEHCRFPPAS